MVWDLKNLRTASMETESKKLYYFQAIIHICYEEEVIEEQEMPLQNKKNGVRKR